MADDRVAKIVHDFFLKSCLLRPRLHRDSYACLWQSELGTEFEDRVNISPLSTGSIAEFYIEPMLSCVGDVDLMFHVSSQLAIPQGHPPPTQLPDEFQDVIRVYEITDSGFPGYVYLVRACLLTEIGDDGKFEAEKAPRGWQVYEAHTNEDGPAIVQKHPTAERSDYVSGSRRSVDLVPCIRCLSWPTQAADWPTRRRNYGWPDSATVDRVVSNGCDVVEVAHRLCRQDEWMNKHQWRLSFSRAEITLINSWMKVQQIVYHMLRFFMKNAGLTDIRDHTGSKILSNYNTKTLMLWACEMKGRSWWNGDLNVIGICVKLLHILADWLTDVRCPHYFISRCNLFDSLGNSQLTQVMAHRLQSITEAGLAEWFVDNYIVKCRCLSIDNVSRLFDDISTHAKLQRAVSALGDDRFSDRLYYFQSHFFTSPAMVHQLDCFLSPRLQRYLFSLKELLKIDERLSVYFAAVTFLNIAFKTSRNPLIDEMLDILSALCLQSNDVRRYLNARQSSVLSLGQATKLMKVIANNSHSTVQLIEIELSKAYLYRALRCKDSDSDSIYCLANVYLAVLYYTAGQYQKAIDHCTVVTRSRDHSQCSSHVVQGELLPKIDDDIDSVLGLAVFYQYVRTAALNQQLTQYVSVFSTELLAHYLHIRCQSVVKRRMPFAREVQQYEKCFDESPQMFVTDVIVAHSVGLRHAKYSANCEKLASSRERNKPVTSGQLDTSELVELLQRSAVEHLTTFRQFGARDFGSLCKMITTDYEALYAFKRGDYQRCLQLSIQNVHTLISHQGSSPSVFMCSEFIQLMDDDLVCLAGLMLLVDPSSPCTKASGLILVAISQRILSLYLMTQSQIKLNHPVTSVAQTLDYIQIERETHALFTECAVGRLQHSPIPKAHRYDPGIVHERFDRLLLRLTERKILRYVSGDGSAGSLLLPSGGLFDNCLV